MRLSPEDGAGFLNELETLQEKTPGILDGFGDADAADRDEVLEHLKMKMKVMKMQTKREMVTECLQEERRFLWPKRPSQWGESYEETMSRWTTKSIGEILRECFGSHEAPAYTTLEVVRTQDGKTETNEIPALICFCRRLFNMR